MEELKLYEVDPEYLKYLHSIDRRVSVKYNNRPFVGIVVMVNGVLYLLPLTSQTTQNREKIGKKKRSAKTTTFVRDSSGEEIANILHNNMIPVTEDTCKLKEIDAQANTYESNEVRFIRKHSENIISKAQRVHDERVQGNDSFLELLCCDFELLESKYKEYKENK